MSLRVKTILVIISIASIFTMASYISTQVFTRNNIISTMEKDLALARDIADGLVTTKIGLLEADAFTISERVRQAGSYVQMYSVMLSQLRLFPDIIQLTVYDSEGIYANCGLPAGMDLYEKEHVYADKAFKGETAFTTTHYNNLNNTLVMHMFVPMGPEYVLSATIDGKLFADLLKDYRLFETGSIFLVDAEGAIIANYRENLVLERRNYVTLSAENPELESVGSFYSNMLAQDEGVARYRINGVERISAYKSISSPKAEWHIAVTVPLVETPIATVQNDMTIASAVFLGICVIIAFFFSSLAAKPFLKIEAQNRSLAELNDTVRSVSDAKTRFLANMSHEMRTPLNAIIGLSELTLETSDLGEEAHGNVEKVYNAGTTLLSTVNDILDISKIEAGKLLLIPTEYTLPSLINDTVTQNLLRIGEKPIKFQLDIDESLPMRLYGDELRIKQIISNLLSNAFKYTKKGTVELGIHCTREGDSAWLTFRISDTGIGLNQADIKNLFTDYIQMDKLSNRNIEGTGLGLPITKMISDMMDGSIGVESELGKGSTFTVKVRQKYISDEVIGPLVTDNLKQFKYIDSKRQWNSRLTFVSLPFARVLVVDDIEANLDVARGMMKHYNMQVDCAESGQQAIDAVRGEKTKYNAIFMDHMMPDMDGIEAVRVIREEIGTEYAKTVPIIALTANAIVGTDKFFLENGFQAFLSKPIEIARLDEIIRKWIRDKMRDGEQEYIEAMAEEKPTERQAARSLPWRVDGVNLQKGFERLGYNEDSFVQVLRSFVSGTKPLIGVAERVTKDNLDDYAVIVHGIKGSSRGIGADMAGAQAEALEKAARAKNIGFIATHNKAFIKTVTDLLKNLEVILGNYSIKTKRDKKESPDADILKRLCSSCCSYDMDGVDAAIEQIEEYEYTGDGGLAAWLRENVDQMNFAQITERLSPKAEA